MKSLLNFEKINTAENETLKAYFSLKGKKVYATFNSPERIKIYENNGRIDILSQEELFTATGKHCSHTLRLAIADLLNVQESDLMYSGHVNVTDVYTGNDGETYINTSQRGNQHGSRLHMTLRTPKGVNVQNHSQLDCRMIKAWVVMASTGSPYKKPLKSFKKSVTA